MCKTPSQGESSPSYPCLACVPGLHWVHKMNDTLSLHLRRLLSPSENFFLGLD